MFNSIQQNSKIELYLRITKPNQFVNYPVLTDKGFVRSLVEVYHPYPHRSVHEACYRRGLASNGKIK